MGIKFNPINASSAPGGVTEVEATDLDIRDLAFATDEVNVTGSTVAATQSGVWDEVGIHDSGNSITVDDGGASLTVDGAVTVSATNLDIRDIDAASDDITVHGDVGVLDQIDLTNTNPLAVAIVDGDGTQITSFGGGTQYTEDAAAAANPVGTAVNLIRADTPAATVSDNGDNIAQRGTNFGAAYVTLLDSSGNTVAVGGGTQYTEDAAAAANPVGTAMIMVREDARAGSLTNTDGDNVAARGTNAGELYVKHVDPIPVTQSGAWDEVGIHDSGNSITIDNAALSVVGGGVEATALRVTIASDSTGVLSIDDNGGAITVDGTVAVTGVSTVAEQQTQTTHLATIAGDTTDIETAVELIDDTVATLGTTTYTEAATKGLIIGAIRRDADTTLVDTTNEVSPLQVDAAGRLKVEAFSGETLPVSLTSTTITGSVAVTNAGTFATQVDGAALTALQLIDDTVQVLGTDTYTETTSKGITLGAVRRDADTTLVGTTNEFTPLQTDANGRLKVEAFSGETLPVSLTSTTITGDALTALQLIDDTVYTDDTSTHATGTSKGNLMMAAAAPTDAAVNANDIGAVAMTVNRELHVSLTTALPAGSANIGDIDVLSVVPGTGATNLGKAEDGGHTSGDVGVFNLGVRVDTPNTALTNTDADYSPITTNKLGSLRIAPLEDDLATAATKHTYKYYTNAGAVTDGIIWSPAAGARWFLTMLVINVSAACTVTIEDDVAAGDVVRFKFELAANSGVVLPFGEVPMFSGEDAADLLVTTTAGNIYITCVGYEI
jgi:hypothetical protein